MRFFREEEELGEESGPAETAAAAAGEGGECVVVLTSGGGSSSSRGPGEASTSDRPCGSDRVRERREGSPTRAAGAAVEGSCGGGEEEEEVWGVDYDDFYDDPNVGERASGRPGGDDGRSSAACDGGGRGARRRKRRGGGDGDGDGDGEEELNTKRRHNSSSRGGRGGGGLTRGAVGSALRTATLAVCVLACLVPHALGSLYSPGASPDGGDGTPVTVPTAVTGKLPETTGTAADAKLTYAAYYSIAPYLGVATGGTEVRTTPSLTSHAPTRKFFLLSFGFFSFFFYKDVAGKGWWWGAREWRAMRDAAARDRARR